MHLGCKEHVEEEVARVPQEAGSCQLGHQLAPTKIDSDRMVTYLESAEDSASRLHKWPPPRQLDLQQRTLMWVISVGVVGAEWPVEVPLVTVES